MKASFLTASAAFALLSSAIQGLSQGTVSFQNGGSGYCIVSNETTGATAKIQSDQYAFSLYVGSSASEVLSSSVPVLTITNHGFGGIISASTYTVDRMVPGTTYSFDIKAWKISAGATFDLALAAGGPTGITRPGIVTVGGGIIPPGRLFDAFFGGIGPPVLMSVNEFSPIPEPSTLILSGLALAVVALASKCKNQA